MTQNNSRTKLDKSLDSLRERRKLERDRDRAVALLEIEKAKSKRLTKDLWFWIPWGLSVAFILGWGVNLLLFS